MKDLTRLCACRVDSAMNAFCFRSLSAPEIYGFTVSLTGKALPTTLGPWEARHELRLEKGQGVCGIGPASAIIAAIQAHGRYVAKAGEIVVQRKPHHPLH